MTKTNSTEMGRPTMFKNKKAMNLMLTEESRRRLKKAAAREGISPSDLVNILIMEQI